MTHENSIGVKFELIKDVVMVEKLSLVWIVVSTLVFAAPVPSGTPTRAPYTEAQAATFASDIDEAVTKMTVERYKAPSETEVWRAALVALYTATNTQNRITKFETLAQDRNRRHGDYKNLFVKERWDLGNPESLSEGKDLILCLKAMVKAVDKTSELGGIDLTPSRTGIRIPMYSTAPFKIKEVVIGSPAQEAGLRPGDEIWKINDLEVGKLSPSVIQAMLNDTTKDNYTLSISRIGDKTKDYKFTVRPYTPEFVLGVERLRDYTWNYYVDKANKIAHIRIQSIEDGTVQQLWDVLDRLERDGMKGLLLDLRAVKYGDMEYALTICEMFVKKGVLIKTKIKNGETFAMDSADRTPEKGFDKAFFDLPLIVLVNQETSGAGEIIAAALQGNKRANIFGRRTAGGGTAKIPVDLISTKQIKAHLPIGEFFHPNGDKIQRNADEFSELKSKWGVSPTEAYWVPTSLDIAQETTSEWNLLSLRPMNSNEAFKTNDPQYDVARNLALKAFHKELGIKPEK